MKVCPITTAAAVAALLCSFASAGSAIAARINVPGDQATLQAAIDAASAGDFILVAPGTYRENIDFRGKAVKVASSGGPAVTIIDGNQAGSVVTFDSGETRASELGGFTIRNGSSSYGGGGIYIGNASPTIAQNRIIENRAYNGGGIYIWSGSPLISKNVISRNPAGGGIYILGASSAQIIENEISENFSGDAGGVYLFAAGTPTIKDNLIKGNRGYLAGGIATVNDCSALIIQNLIVENSAIDPTVGAGGVLLSIPANLLGPTLANNSIVGNDGPEASGIVAQGFLAHTLLANNVVAGNAVQTAIYCDGTYDPTPPLLSHNLAYAPSSSAFGGTCSSQAGVNGNIETDPRLTDAAAGGYYPRAGSPVIDAGDNSAASLPALDLDGNARISDGNGNGDGSAAVDMGAYEFDPTLPSATITGAPAAATASSGASLVIGGTGIVSYRYALDDSVFGSADIPVAIPVTLTGLADGRHSIRVVGKLADARVQLPSAATIASWIIDPAPPATSASADSGSYLGSFSVTLQCDDGAAGSGCAATLYCLGTGCTPSIPYPGGAIGIRASSELNYRSADNAGNQEALQRRSYSIAFPDTTPPVVTGFSIPGKFSDLTIRTTCYAADNIRVTGYCVTESPDPSGCSWSPTAPASYTLDRRGNHTLYAFARDAAGNVSAPASASTGSLDDFIPAPARADMVYDTARDLLYISSGDLVLRYRLATGSFLSPYKLGGNLAGIDLSPDGNTLAVADRSLAGMHLVDLATDASRQVSFSAVSGEGGSYSVAFGGDGALLASAGFLGSGGGMPLRRYDPATGEIRIVADAAQDAVLSSSADGRCIAYAGSNNFGGPIGIYDVAAQKATHTASAYWFTRPIGASRDCTQFAVPTYGGTFIFDEFLNEVNQIGEYARPQPIEAVYHPAADIVYLAWGGSSEVRAFDTRTFSQLAAYDFLDSFTSSDDTAIVPGRLRISRDGTILFAAVKDGIRFQRLSGTPVADSQSVLTSENRPVAIELTGQEPDAAPLAYQIATTPLHGTLTGRAPSLSYTPDQGYSGEDGFTFTVSDGSATSASAKVTIAVRHDDNPPAIRLALPTASSSLLVVATVDASDNLGVSGYCLSEAASSSGCAWNSAPPIRYAFSTAGSRTLYAFARDDAGNVSPPASASVVITLSDTTAPGITGFRIPPKSSSLSVPVTLSSAEEWANYCLSETADATGCNWSHYLPESYNFGDYGTRTLYAFVRDLAGNVSAPASATVLLTGTRNLIPAPQRFDMVYDGGRDVVYITSGTSVLRYHLATGSFLTPYNLGGFLQGVDLSPDGATLAVADAQLTGIHLVDLRTDTVQPDVSFTPGSGEGGSYAVAFGADGALLVTTAYNGSGWTPLRRVDPATRSVTIVDKPSVLTPLIRNKTHISASAGGTCIGYAEGDSSDGPLGIYDVASQRITRLLEISTGTGASNSAIGSNRDCSQFAVVSDSGTFVYDAALSTLTRFGHDNDARPMGVAYHPSSEIFYLSWPDSSEVRAYDSRTFSQLAAYDVGATLVDRAHGGNFDGRLRTARDGSLLLITVIGGIYYQRLSAGVLADDQSIATRLNTPVSIPLTGSNLNASSAGYQLLSFPAHGALTGTAPDLTYTPAASFSGQDSFTFAIGDGAGQSNAATVSLTVLRDSTPPVINAFRVGYYQPSTAVSISELSASDDFAVSSYCLSETASTSNCNWSARAPGSYTLAVPQPPQGLTITTTLYAFARDAALNVSNPVSTQVYLTVPDTTPPTIAGFRIPSSNIGLTIPVAVLAADNLEVYSYCLTESSNPSVCSWTGQSPASYSFVSGGEHILNAFARDAAGNLSSSAGAAVTILLPAAFTSGPSTVFEVGSPNSFTVTTTGYPAPVLTVSGALPPGFTFTDLGNGTATIAGTATDASVGIYSVMLTATNGVLEPAELSFTVTVIKPPPRLTVSALSDGAVCTSPVLNVSGMATSPSGIKSLTVNGLAASLTPEGAFSTAVNLLKGANTISVVATDQNGISTTEIRTIFLDAGAPPFTVTSPVDGSVSSSQFIEMTGVLAAPAAMVLYIVNYQMPQWAHLADLSFSASAQLEPGINTVEVAVIDPQGNLAVLKRTVFYNPAFSLSVTDPGEDLKTGASSYLLQGTISNNTTPVTVSVAVDDGQTYHPAVSNGAFEQQLCLAAEKVYAVTVTATDQNGTRISVRRNFTRVWFGDLTNASNGSGEITLMDAYNTLLLVEGGGQVTAGERLRVDVAPLSPDGKPQGDGALDIADVIMALRKLIGASTW